LLFDLCGQGQEICKTIAGLPQSKCHLHQCQHFGNKANMTDWCPCQPAYQMNQLTHITQQILRSSYNKQDKCLKKQETLCTNPTLQELYDDAMNDESVSIPVPAFELYT